MGGNNARFAEIDIQNLPADEIKKISLQHELIHPYALKLMQELFPKDQFHNFHMDVEFMVTALHDVAFWNNGSNPSPNPAEHTSLEFKTGNCMKRITSYMVSNAVRTVNPEFLEHIQQDVKVKVDTLTGVKSEDVILSYDFNQLDIDRIKAEALKNINQYISSYQTGQPQTMDESIYTYSFPSLELMDLSFVELSKFANAQEILQTLISIKQW